MGVHPPSVDALARGLTDVGLPHALVVGEVRAAAAAGDVTSARRRVEALAATLLRPVINATGVLLHTNLGRAPAAPFPNPAVTRYSNVELDLTTGRRGSRSAHAANLVARAAGADAALVVNNGAAAILLALTATAGGREVVVSRGELVEIGGGFRIPEVLASSGAAMVEVGTTNKTRLDDYRSALTAATAACLKVHPSNYRIVGFSEDVGVRALAGLGPAVIVDLGSGLLDATTPWLGGPRPWLAGEPGVRQTLADGAALVTFSCDKLLGGPQAGVIAGRRALVDACARHPLARALRPGGLILAHLQHTALAYLRADAASLPLWAMAARSVESLRARAEALGAGTVVDISGTFGGGAQAGRALPSAGVSMNGDHTDALRQWDPPIIARVAGGATLVDLRTVDPDDDEEVGKGLAACPPAPAAPAR